MKRRDSQRGAAVVEFALIVGLLIVFLFGIFEFGFLWLNSYYIANSAREGARVAAKTGGSEAADVAARVTAAETAVAEYLSEYPLFSSRLTEAGFLTTSYRDGTFTVTVNSEEITMPLSVVMVTVQTARVWEPVLWPLLSALIPGSNVELREITQTASFAIE